jgi:predicted outer membrane protein
LRGLPGLHGFVAAIGILHFAAACGAGSPDGAAQPATGPDVSSDASSDAAPDRAAAPDAATPSPGADAGACVSPVFPVCSDAQVLAIAIAENQAHVDVANAVRERLASAAAISLASKIVTDDSVTAVQLAGLVRETGITPVAGALDAALAAEAAEEIQSLASLDPAAVDAAYVHREVLSHLRALGLFERILSPSVHDDRIRIGLESVQGLVVEHMQAVARAQTALGQTCGSIEGR